MTGFVGRLGRRWRGRDAGATRRSAHVAARSSSRCCSFRPRVQTGLTELEGKLQKLSTKGRWQTRYFQVSGFPSGRRR
jgi:hypothetical protein